MSVRTVELIELHCVDHCNNNCRWCNSHSPFAPDRTYDAEEYYPWLDTLVRNRIGFSMLSITGGEPFLHPRLFEFCQKLRQRYAKRLMLSTNLFWLSEFDIEFHRPLFGLLHTLRVTVFPNMVRGLGGLERVQKLLERLKATTPQVYVDVRLAEEHFCRLEFTAESLDVDQHCPCAESLNLLVDGRLARCAPGAYAQFSPHAIREFRESADMFYDLRQPGADFWHWKYKWPMDACSHCTHFRQERSPWKVESGTRRRRELEARYNLNLGAQLEQDDPSPATLRRQDGALIVATPSEARGKLPAACLHGNVYYMPRRQGIQVRE